MLMLSIFSILTRCLGFIFKIYLTKIMTTTELGVYNLTLSVYMVLITIVGSSIPLTISKITASNKCKSHEFDTNYSVTSSLILTTSISILLCLMLLISKPLLNIIIGSELGYAIIISLIPSIVFTAIYSQIRGYLWGLENYFAVSMVEFVEQILRIGLCLLFGLTNWFSSPIIAVGTALSIACGISTTYGIILYFKNGGRFKYKNGYFKNIIKSSLPLTLMRLFGSLLQPLIAIILPLRLCSLGMTKELALSELGIVMGMTMPLLSIPSTIIGAMCMILIPRINGAPNSQELQHQINNYLKFTITCTFIFIPIFLSLSSSICTYVFDNALAGTYMRNCAWIIIPHGLSQITSSILNAISEEHKSFTYYVISSIFLIILILILPSFVGIQSMIIASGLSSVLLLLLNFHSLKKCIHFKPHIIKPIFYHALISIPVIILNNFCYNIFINCMSMFLSIAFTAVISVLGYISLLFVFGIMDINIVKDYLLQSIKSKQKNAHS